MRVHLHGRDRRISQVILGVALAAVIVVGAAAPVFAHAGLLLASPAPGSGLPQAPGEVVLRFSEPLDIALSRISITGPDGADGGQGQVLRVTGDPNAMQRRVGVLHVGVYAVHWRSVSALDGHAVSGTYQFGIGTAVVGAESVSDDPVSSEGWAGLVARLLTLGGLAVWFGASMLARWRRLDARSRFRLARFRRAAPVVVLIGTVLLAVSSALRLTGSLSALPSVLSGNQSGWLRLLILAAAGCGVVLSGRRWANDFLVVAAIGAEAAAGHAAAAPYPVVATVVFAVHLAAVGVWLTAIVMAVASGTDVVRELSAVAPLAVAAAGTVAATGVVAAAFEVDHVGALLDTRYGEAVLVKASVLVAMVLAGLVHRQLRRRPKAKSRQVRRPVAAEAMLAVGGLVVATVLTGFPTPPREEAAAEAATHTEATLTRVASGSALSLAAADGPFVIGLTLSPPEPGPVTVLVTVVGAEPGDGLRDAHLTGASESDPALDAPLHSCGFGCFTGNVALPSDHWQLSVLATSNRGPLRFDTEVTLPVADGTSDLQRTRLVMNGLQSAQLTETIRGSADGAAQLTDYVFGAPDRMRFDSSDGTSAVFIGADSYRRDAASKAWIPNKAGTPFSWPSNFYDSYWSGAMAIRRLGTTTVDGTPTTVIAFVRPDLPAWFRVWVDASGRIRHLEMRTDGHIMDQGYDKFDAAEPVTAPG